MFVGVGVVVQSCSDPFDLVFILIGDLVSFAHISHILFVCKFDFPRSSVHPV